jgi:hypothetical protein
MPPRHCCAWLLLLRTILLLLLLLLLLLRFKLLLLLLGLVVLLVLISVLCSMRRGRMTSCHALVHGLTAAQINHLCCISLHMGWNVASLTLLLLVLLLVFGSMGRRLGWLLPLPRSLRLAPHRKKVVLLLAVFYQGQWTCGEGLWLSVHWG